MHAVSYHLGLLSLVSGDDKAALPAEYSMNLPSLPTGLWRYNFAGLSLKAVIWRDQGHFQPSSNQRGGSGNKCVMGCCLNHVKEKPTHFAMGVCYYPVCACAAGVKQCCRVCVCVCECVSKKKIKNASSRVARTFKDIILNEKQPVKSYWNILYLTQGSSFHCYFNYFLLLVSWLHPFWNRTWYLRSANAQENIPWIHSSFQLLAGLGDSVIEQKLRVDAPTSPVLVAPELLVKVLAVAVAVSKRGLALYPANHVPLHCNGHLQLKIWCLVIAPCPQGILIWRGGGG